jgi:hypothetical protein
MKRVMWLALRWVLYIFGGLMAAFGVAYHILDEGGPYASFARYLYDFPTVSVPCILVGVGIIVTGESFRRLEG